MGLASPPPPGDPSGVPACGSSPSMLATLVVDSHGGARPAEDPGRKPGGECPIIGSPPFNCHGRQPVGIYEVREKSFALPAVLHEKKVSPKAGPAYVTDSSR
jgi:hypothetical protein